MLLLIASIAFHLTIDAGSFYTKLAQFSVSEYPSILFNHHSKRLTPTFLNVRSPLNRTTPIKFNEAKRLKIDFGDDAYQELENHPNSSSGLFSRYSGYLPENVQELNEGILIPSASFRTTFRDSLSLFYFLFIDSISRQNIIKDITLVFPAHFTVNQREFTEHVLSANGYVVHPSIDDVDAIIHFYANERAPKTASKSHSVLFVDIGATSVKAYVVVFKLDSTKQKWSAVRFPYQHDGSNGGVYLTQILIDYVIKKAGLSKLSEDDKIKLFPRVEKAKQELSMLDKVEINIADFNSASPKVEITLQELEKLGKPLKDTVIDIAKAAAKSIRPKDIEIIGGSSRLIFIQKALSEAFKVDAVGHLLNPDESIALGAAYYLQDEQGVSRLGEISIEVPQSLYSVTLRTSGGNTSICKQGSRCPTEYDFPGNAHYFIFDYVQNEVEEGIYNYTFGTVVHVVDSRTLRVKFNGNPFSIQKASSCNGSECTEGQLVQINKAGKESTVFRGFKKSFSEQKEISKQVNAIESLVNQYSDELEFNETVRYFSNETQRDEVRVVIEKVRQWIQNQSLLAPNMTELKNNTKWLKDTMDPIHYRILGNETKHSWAPKLGEALKESRKLLDQLDNQTMPWLNMTIVNELNRTVSLTDSLLHHVFEGFKNIQPWERPTFPFKDCKTWFHRVEREQKEIKKLMETPKDWETKKYNYPPYVTPEPPKEEKKESENSDTNVGEDVNSKVQQSESHDNSNPVGDAPSTNDVFEENQPTFRENPDKTISENL